MEKKWLGWVAAVIFVALAFLLAPQLKTVLVTLPHSGENVQLPEIESSDSYRSWSFLAEKIDPTEQIIYRGEGDPGGARYYLHYSDSTIEYTYTNTRYLEEYNCIRGNCSFPFLKKTVQYNYTYAPWMQYEITITCSANGTYQKVVVASNESYINTTENRYGTGCPI